MVLPMSLPSCFLALYAETHYTLPLGLSLVRRDFPEILADLPWRLDPGQPLTVLCLITVSYTHLTLPTN